MPFRMYSVNRLEKDWLQVTQVPVWLLKATRGALRGFQWARDAADRLVRVLPRPHTLLLPTPPRFPSCW